MNAKKIFLSFLFLISVCAAGYPSVKDSGLIINENPSVRAASLGYSYTANITDDAFGIFSNPAFFPSSPVTAISYSSSFKNKNEFTTAAFSFLYPDIFSKINVGIAFVSSLEGEIKEAQDSAVYINLSRKFGFLSAGLNWKYIHSHFYKNSGCDGFTADAGLRAAVGAFSAGIAGHNLFGKFKNTYEEKINPSFDADIAFEFRADDFLFMLSGGGVWKNIDKDKVNPRAGFEIFYKFASLKLGYEYDNDLKEKGIYFAGFGIETKYVIFDYAFIEEQNDFKAGDIHKIAFAYRFAEAVKSDKKEEIKRQKKFDKMKAKDEKKNLKNQKKETAGESKKKKREKNKQSLPLQPVSLKEHDTVKEFAAVLVEEQEKQEDISKEKSSLNEKNTHKKKNKIKIRVKDKGNFDAAKYILENPDIKSSVKEYLYSPTPVNKYDFDAARYILEKPGQVKIQEYYFKPTPVSEDDFDAALFLIEQGKSSQESGEPQNAQNALDVLGE